MSALTWSLILAGVGLNAIAQLLIKIAARPLAQVSEFSRESVTFGVSELLRSAPFWGGMLCYGASLCVWVAALARAPVSTAYPMLSLGYVVVAVIAMLSLDERLSSAQMLGIGLICLGVFLVSRSPA